MKSAIITLAASLQIISVSSTPVADSRSLICGKAGYDKGTESFISTTAGTYAGCLKACSKHKECESFAFASGDCELYDVSARSNFVPVSDSPYLFYDISCSSPASSTTTTTSAKSSTKSSSTMSTTKPSSTTSITTTRSTTKSSPSTTTTTSQSTVKTSSITSTTPKSTTTTLKSSSTTSTPSKSTTTSVKTSSPTPSRATTTTPLSTTSSATTASTTPSNSGAFCNAEGGFVGSGAFDGYQTDNAAETEENLLACYNFCIHDTEDTCEMWSWSPSGCAVYGWHPKYTFTQYDNPNGPLYWDVNCGPPQMGSTSSTA